MVKTLKQGASKQIIKNLLINLFKDQKNRGIDAYKYVGKITLKTDALNIQRELRDEWE